MSSDWSVVPFFFKSTITCPTKAYCRGLRQTFDCTHTRFDAVFKLGAFASPRKRKDSEEEYSEDYRVYDEIAFVRS